MDGENMVQSMLPIYPKSQDLVIMIEVIDEVMGGGAPSILFRIGEKMGSRYARDIMQTIPGIEPSAGGLLEDKALRNLIASGWYEEVKVERVENGIDITIKNSFELGSGRNKCDFLRGFLVGNYQGFTGERYLSSEKHDANKKKCLFRLRIID